MKSNSLFTDEDDARTSSVVDQVILSVTNILAQNKDNPKKQKGKKEREGKREMRSDEQNYEGTKI